MSHKVAAVDDNSNVESMLNSVNSSIEVQDRVNMADHLDEMRAGKGWMVGNNYSEFSATFVVKKGGEVLLTQTALDELSKALDTAKNAI